MKARCVMLLIAAMVMAACATRATTVAVVPSTLASPSTPTPSPTPLPYQDCGWTWAQQSLPEISATFQKALVAQGLAFDSEKTFAYAFGENCLDSTGQVNHFAAMETDFVVGAALPDPGNQAARGDFAGAVIKVVLDQFRPIDVVPGPQPGFVEFNFGGGESPRRVSLVDAKSAVQSGLTGAALYQALFP